MNNMFSSLLTPSSPDHKHFWQRWPKTTLVVLLILFISVPLAAFRLARRGLPGAQENVLGMYGDELWNFQDGSKQGVATVNHSDDYWRIVVKLKLPELGKDEHYHGWLKDPNSGETKYAGDLFVLFSGEYSITYTTQENIAHFSSFVISKDSSSSPTGLQNIVAEWKLSSNPKPTPTP